MASGASAGAFGSLRTFRLEAVKVVRHGPRNLPLRPTMRGVSIEGDLLNGI